jgi:hypothetical protein
MRRSLVALVAVALAAQLLLASPVLAGPPTHVVDTAFGAVTDPPDGLTLTRTG